MGRKISKELREAVRRAEVEKDTIYYLDFIPKDGRRVNRTTALDDPWCVRLICNPQRNPELITEAIRTFEAKHQVKSWSEVAVSYQVNSFYYP